MAACRPKAADRGRRWHERRNDGPGPSSGGRDQQKRQEPEEGTGSERVPLPLPIVHPELPFGTRRLLRTDEMALRPLLAYYLRVQKQRALNTMTPLEVRRRWKRFRGKWNRGELAEGWYDPAVLARPEDAGGDDDEFDNDNDDENENENDGHHNDDNDEEDANGSRARDDDIGPAAATSPPLAAADAAAAATRRPPREARREEAARARRRLLDLRLEGWRRREEGTVSMLRELARQRFG